MSFATVNRLPPVSDEQQYRLLRAVTFPIFLVAAASGRLRPADRRGPTDAPRSIFAEARAASANALLFAFGG